MLKTGLFINDLSMHDSSRDLVLAGTQQSAELKMALDRVRHAALMHITYIHTHVRTHESTSHKYVLCMREKWWRAQEQQKSKKLEEIMRQLDVEIRRTDELLYQMIPRSIANRLRRGATAIETCKACLCLPLHSYCTVVVPSRYPSAPVMFGAFALPASRARTLFLLKAFDEVSVLFSDMVGFTATCSHLTPLQVVTMLNNMYTAFDQLSEKHHMYKVCCSAPRHTHTHTTHPFAQYYSAATVVDGVLWC